MTDIGTVFTIIGICGTAFGMAALYSVRSIEWMILRLRARRLALMAYREEYSRVMKSGEIG
jgi:hypothetical protein